MLRHAMFAIVLIALGWVASEAQSQRVPDFELSVITKDGKTTVECLRGCGLQWVEWVIPDPAGAQKTVSFGPCGSRSDGCPSGRLGGWISK
jgi:hypothetical protein